MKQEWVYANACFDADKYDDTMLRFSPWSGHRQFGYDLVTYLEPKIVVELGSFYGCSSFAFMQAIKDNQLNTIIYPVDLWEAGDTFTLHDYEQDIYSFFKNIKEQEFSNINVNMMKMSFDEACLIFEDQSIDLLHIDGSHAYEDVKHDFMKWLPKLKSNALVLFHDISEQLLYGEKLGSSIFWKEIKEKYKWTIEMQYSWGLGILFLTENMYKDFVDKVDINYYFQLNTYAETQCKDRIRKDYFKLLDCEKWIKALQKDKGILEKDNKNLLEELKTVREDYEKSIYEKDNYVSELRSNIRVLEDNCKYIQTEYDNTILGKNLYIEELKNTIKLYAKESGEIKQNYEITIQEKESYIEELQTTKEKYVKENEIIRQKYEMTIQEKESYIQELQKTIETYAEENEIVKQKYEMTIQEKESYIQELQKTIETYAEENEIVKQKYEVTIQEKESYIQELQKTIETYVEENETVKQKYEMTIQEKEKYIQELQRTIEIYVKENEAIKQRYEMTGQEKETYIEELHGVIQSYMQENENIRNDYEETIKRKDSYIEEMQEAYFDEKEKVKKDYEETIKGKDTYIKELELSIKELQEKSNRIFSKLK